jgi:hypothetical protein
MQNFQDYLPAECRDIFDYALRNKPVQRMVTKVVRMPFVHDGEPHSVTSVLMSCGHVDNAYGSIERGARRRCFECECRAADSDIVAD